MLRLEELDTWIERGTQATVLSYFEVAELLLILPLEQVQVFVNTTKLKVKPRRVDITFRQYPTDETLRHLIAALLVKHKFPQKTYWLMQKLPRNILELIMTQSRQGATYLQKLRDWYTAWYGVEMAHRLLELPIHKRAVHFVPVFGCELLRQGQVSLMFRFLARLDAHHQFQLVKIMEDKHRHLLDAALALCRSEALVLLLPRLWRQLPDKAATLAAIELKTDYTPGQVTVKLEIWDDVVQYAILCHPAQIPVLIRLGIYNAGQIYKGPETTWVKYQDCLRLLKFQTYVTVSAENFK